ncbi:MAG: PadR family transcriptional regulator [Anaerolineae bacterium]
MLSKDLVAASSRPLVLSILSKNESYGYEILKTIKERSKQQIEWKDGMIYPLLRKLENDDLIESFWNTADSGRKRKYYRIKTAGKIYLAEQKKQWALINSVLDQLWEDDLCLS